MISNPPIYQVMPFDGGVFGFYILYAMLITGLSWLLLRFIKPLPKIRVGNLVLYTWILLGTFSNVAFMLYVSDEARYTSGGLTGFPGMVYVIGRGFNLSAFVLLIRCKAMGHRIPMWILVALTASYASTIDGFASALLILTFVIIYFSGTVRGPWRLLSWIGIFAFSAGMGHIALIAKWGPHANDILRGELLWTWIVPRFAVQAETMYSFLFGSTTIQSLWDVINLILRAIGDRFDILLGHPFQLAYPRSVSESFYDSVFGGFGAGSSPGALLGTAMFGPLMLWLMPSIFGFLFLQMYYKSDIKQGLVQVIAFGFLLKGLYTDSSEYFTVVSPTVIYVVFFLVGCLLIPRRRG